MIQGVSSNFNNTKAQSFGNKEAYSAQPELTIKQRRPSKTARVLGFTAGQIATGAVVSAVFDGMTNLYRTAFKKGNLIGGKEIAKRAGFWGLTWLAVGIVFNAIGAIATSSARKYNPNGLVK